MSQRSRLSASLRSLRHSGRTVRGKLVGMVLLNTLVVLLVSGVAIIAHDLYLYRSIWAADVNREAAFIARSVAPALARNDVSAAARGLAVLEGRPTVQAVALYRADGTRVAGYTQAGVSDPDPAQAVEGLHIRGTQVEVLQPVQFDGVEIGTLHLLTRYDVSNRLEAFVGILALITGLSLLLALVLSASLQRAITVPLDAITRVAQQIVERRDYRLRVDQKSDDEIGIVVRAFNSMLDEVQQRTQALERLNASLVEEIEDRQAAEAALARANARLETTLAAAEIGSWVWDLKTGQLDVDRNFAAMYGIHDADAFRSDPGLRRSRIHAEDRDKVEDAEVESLGLGSLASTEFRIVQPDGTTRWVIGRGKVQFDASGMPHLLAGLLIDVTPQKLAEQQQREVEQVYRAIGQSIDYGIWLADAEGRNTYASESFLRLIGRSQEEYSRYGWSDLLEPDDRHAALEAWAESRRGASPWYRELRIRGADGAYHPVLSQGVPVHREDGSIYAWAGINLDISRLKQTEAALRSADRQKDEFLATLAHELRNPLAPIRNASDMLGIPSISDTQRAWARDVIARQVHHMALLLDDLLDLSRITRGRVELRLETVSLAQLVQSAVETARPLIDAKQHRLALELPEQPVQLRVDPLRIAQALSNLLTNAAKYTDAGGHIRVEARAGAAGVSIAVSDDGIGLTREAIARVFEMFAQVENQLDRSQGGLGIGLALAQGLANLHGGRVEASSPGPGRGSTFTLELPATAVLATTPALVAAEPPPPAMPAMASRTFGILIADDNRDAADSLAMLLRFLGYDVCVAYSGRDALDQARGGAARVLILDIGMPEMNGYEVARAVRESSWGASLTLIALTGWGQSEDVERAHRAGFDHHLRKPVDIDALQACLGQTHVSP